MNLSSLRLSLINRRSMKTKAKRLNMAGLTNGIAIVGDHAGLTVPLPNGVAAWQSQAWGVGIYGDASFGIGSSPTDVADGDLQVLLWQGIRSNGAIYHASAPIRYAPGVVAGPLVQRMHTVGVPIVPFSIAPEFSGTGLNFTFRADGLPTGLDMSTAGQVTGTPGAVASASVMVTAIDQYGRILTSSYSSVVQPFPAISGAVLTNIAATTATYRSQLNRTGSLHRLISANPTETAATVKAVPAVLAEAQSDVLLNITDLPVEAQFYVHEIGIDDQGNETPVTVTGGATTITIPPGTAAGALPDRSHTVGVSIVPYDVAGDFSGPDLDFTFGASGLPSGLAMSAAGQVTGTPTAVASGSVQITATDQFGRTVTSGYGAAVQPFPAVSGAVLSDIAQTTATYRSRLNRAGSLYRLVSSNPSETAAAVKAVPSVSAVANTNVLSNITGLAAEAPFYVHEIGIDDQGNETGITVTGGTTLDPDATAPVISNVSWDQGSGAGSAFVTKGGMLYAATHMAADDPVAGGAGGWASPVLETFAEPVADSGVVWLNLPETEASTAAEKMSFYIRAAEGANSTIETVDYAYPVVPPVSSVNAVDQADDLGTNGVPTATVANFFEAAGTYVVGIGCTCYDSNDHSYTLSGPNVTAVAPLAETTGDLTSGRTNCYMYLVEVSAPGDLVCTITGAGTSFDRTFVSWRADDRTAIGAITGIAKSADAGPTGTTLNAASVPAGHQVFAIFSNRTGSMTGVQWTGDIQDTDEVYDAQTTGAPNRLAAAAITQTVSGDVSTTIIGIGDDVSNSANSAIIVALGAA